MKIIHTISWVAAIGIAASLAMIMPAFARTRRAVGASARGGAWVAAGHSGMRGRDAAWHFRYGEFGER